MEPLQRKNQLLFAFHQRFYAPLPGGKPRYAAYTVPQRPLTLPDKVETVDYGKLIHILDIEGNKIELWEPNDVAFDKPGIMMYATTTK
jgi:hypothetical protein